MEAPTKISGYLEKKGSLKMISSWKKYWFVLEGQLLLYYRSKDEYEGISPCKGSINLCPPCFIKPCNSEKCVFRIEKKTNSITLKAKNRMEQDKWMQGLLMALKSNSLSQSRLSHYRFSACEFGTLEKQKPLQRHRSMPTRYSRNDLKSHPEVLERLREMSAQPYTVHMPKNKLVRRYGSGGQLYASVGECPVEGQEKRCSVDSFVVENDIYETLPERVLCRKLSVCYESTESERPSICDVDVVDDEEYGSIGRRRSFSGSNNTPKDYDYCSISPSKDSDYNKNTIIIENDQYVSSLLSENFGSTNLTEEAIYEEIDKIREKLGFPQDDLIYTEVLDNSATTEESFRKSPKRTLLRNKKSDEKRRSLKKRRSFFGKIMHKWKKRRRVLMNQEEIDRNMRMLLELQQILSQRKAALEQAASDVVAADTNYEGAPDDEKDDSTSTEPALPPKTLSKHYSPYHDTPRNNNPIFLHNTPEVAKITPQKSIDEILDDLDMEKEEQSRPNVKKMIQRFSVPNKEEDEVVLRRQKQHQSIVTQDKSVLRHSDDLNDLLEKLGEMTVAPPMEPGVTSSLASPPVSDEEWLKLLPIRKRRMSDPDYDIPRPHRSLVFEPKTENPENVIPATRFFGPVLESSDFQDIRKSLSSPTCVSISPDSLEIIEKSEQSANVENISYTSHFYSAKQGKHYDEVIFVHSKWRPIENDSIESSNEIFVDSLETTTEHTQRFRF